MPARMSINPSARAKLELSRQTQQSVQREGMGIDVDVQNFMLYLAQQTKLDIVERIVSAPLSRTMSGSSQVQVVINDYDQAVLNSGLLYNKLDVQLDGLWFRLSGCDLQDDELTLTFEDREIAVLRTYTKWRIARRSKITRAQFVLALIREVKEFEIPVNIPELHTIQPVERFPGDTIGKDTLYTKGQGIHLGINQTPPKKSDANRRFALYAGEGPATKEQILNANIIIAVGKQMGVSRKLKVCAIMTAIHESRLRNVPHGDIAGPDSRGLFQQRASWGSEADRLNPETASRLFYNQALKTDKEDPNYTYEYFCLRTQFPGVVPGPGTYGSPFSLWRTQAEQFVTASGSPGGDTTSSAASANGMFANTGSGGDFYFYRGKLTSSKGKKVRKPENSWDCIQRLSDEVDWRGFFISGAFWFLSEDDLLKQQPQFTISRFTEGIRNISGNFYQHKKSAQFQFTCDVGRWTVPPGAVVLLKDLGPWNGRWLVSEYSRDLFDTEATVTLVRERPQLPEPLQGNATNINTAWVPKAADRNSGTGGGTSTPQNDPKITGRDIDLANQLIADYSNRSWRDENGRGRAQLTKIAMGQKLYNPFTGTPVIQDPRTMKVVLWLISQGYDIGTYAWTEDHDGTNDGSSGRGHVNGYAVDIESINGHHIAENSTTCAELTLQVAKLLNGLQGELAPAQLICGGYGNQRDFAISAMTIPNTGFYGDKTMAEHTNHIHVGY